MEKYIVTQEHIDANPFFASLNIPVGTEVEYDPAVVISREEAIARGIDVEAVEASATTSDEEVDETQKGGGEDIEENLG